VALSGRVRIAENQTHSFRPEVVLSLMERRNFTDLAFRFSREHNIPLVLIMHDLVGILNPFTAGLQAPSADGMLRSTVPLTHDFVSGQFPDTGLRNCMGAGDGVVSHPFRIITPRPSADSLKLRNPPFLTLAYAGSLSYGYAEQISALGCFPPKAGAKLFSAVRDARRVDADRVRRTKSTY
jgi:hypothetical protein